MQPADQSQQHAADVHQAQTSDVHQSTMQQATVLGAFHWKYAIECNSRVRSVCLGQCFRAQNSEYTTARRDRIRNVKNRYDIENL